jgi:cbb3-type cytochrome oxidase subunit 3
MKFINYLEKITGVDVYALTSFLIFFTFFVVMTLWALRADKKMIDVLSNIPLDDNDNNNCKAFKNEISN